MHSLKKKNPKTSLAINTKLSMCSVTPHNMSHQENGRIRQARIKSGSNCGFTKCRGLTP
ncbi:unnamed protein product [Staurois parvus]|uniref:Uncharacterized protein n=1 Tax=Staurois parvus TaxID=386267 RepID=A0ABN9DKG1_9NEOB|nr:unnamed protein product [Staurois parvus]